MNYCKKKCFSRKRSKISPFNTIGTVAQSLFGILDSDYVDEMTKTISEAKSDKYHIIQTSARRA